MNEATHALIAHMGPADLVECDRQIRRGMGYFAALLVIGTCALAIGLVMVARWTDDVPRLLGCLDIVLGGVCLFRLRPRWVLLRSLWTLREAIVSVLPAANDESPSHR